MNRVKIPRGMIINPRLAPTLVDKGRVARFWIATNDYARLRWYANVSYFQKRIDKGSNVLRFDHA